MVHLLGKPVNLAESVYLGGVDQVFVGYDSLQDSLLKTVLDKSHDFSKPWSFRICHLLYIFVEFI